MFFSLRSRLMAVFSILLIVPFTALAFILSKESTSIIQASIETSTTQTIEQFASHVITLSTQVEDIGNQVMSNRITQEWLSVQLNPDNTIEERVLTKQRLREYFSSYAINNSNGITISAFAREAGGMWTQDRSYLKSEWYKEFEENGQRWTNAHLDPDQADDSARIRYVNSFVLPLVQLQSLTNTGVVKINFPTSLLQNAIEKIRFGETGKAFLLTSDGRSVLNQDLSGEAELLKQGLAEWKSDYGDQTRGVFSVTHNRVDHLFFFRTLPVGDWIVVGEVPQGQLYQKISNVRQTILFVSLILLILAMFAALWISFGITRPLSSMAKAMKHVKKGEFHQALKLMAGAKPGHSEVGYVTEVFVEMTDRLKYLIETEFETNLRRKNAEYKALLLQINPHFYNNTLEIISGLAAQKREDLIMDATESLGKMMRYSLNLNSDIIRIGEEFDYIRDYLFIMKLRFGDRLNVNIEEDPAARQLLVAKFVLQPLVENAIKYSLEKEGEARIEIASLLEQDYVELKVKDNGIGMAPGLVEDLLSKAQNSGSIAVLSSEGHSIGLRNVLSRCRLYYGERFQLNLESQPGEGTAITLRLPIIRG